MTAPPQQPAAAGGAVVVAWESRRDAQQVLFAQRALLGRDVVALCPIDPAPPRRTASPRRGVMDELISRQRELVAARSIEAWADRLRAEGVDVDAVVRRGDPVEALVREAGERGAGAVALAVRPPPAVFGGTLARLVRRAPAPVLLLREPRRPGGEVHRIAAALDVGAPPAGLLRAVAALAAAHDAEVVLVATGDPFEATTRAAVDEAERLLAASGQRVRVRLVGEVALRPLCALLEEEAPDLIAVAGPAPRAAADAADRMLVQLLLESPSSLLVVQGPARASAAERPSCRRGRLSGGARERSGRVLLRRDGAATPP